MIFFFRERRHANIFTYSFFRRVDCNESKMDVVSYHCCQESNGLCWRLTIFCCEIFKGFKMCQEEIKLKANEKKNDILACIIILQTISHRIPKVSLSCVDVKELCGL